MRKRIQSGDGMYEKVDWTADKLLTPARFRQMETQYDTIIAKWLDPATSFRTNTGEEFIPEVLAEAPAHGAGKLYVNTTGNNLYISDGAAFINLSEFGVIV